MRRTAVLSGQVPNLEIRLFESVDAGKLGHEIDYPDDWPDTISMLFLEDKGFTVVRANVMGVIADDRNKIADSKLE